jgi:hypothetical protein
MFWKRRPAKPKVEKLPGPKDIPELVGRYLITELKQNPDRVWKLKGVVRRRLEGKDAFDFRVFDEAQVAAKKVAIKDYNSLNEHPDLILYQGRFDKKSGEVQIIIGEVQIEEKKAA